MDDSEARERVARVEALLDEVEALADPAARDTALELVQALLDLYGEGLDRIVDHVAAGDDGAPRARARGRRAGVAPAAAARPASGAGRGPRARGAGRGPPLPRVARRQRRAAGGRGGRRAAAAAGQLQRLPVVGDDAEARDRGGDPQGRARRGRGGGRRRAGPARRGRGCCRSSVLPARPHRAGGPVVAGRVRPRRCPTASSPLRRSPASRCSSSKVGGTLLRLPAVVSGVRRVARGRAARAARSSGARGAPLATTSAARAAGWAMRDVHLEPVPLLVDDGGLVRVAWLGVLMVGSRSRRSSPGARRRRRRRGRPRALRPCSAPIAPEHRHLLDLDQRELMCACRACSLLFDRGAAGAATTGSCPTGGCGSTASSSTTLAGRSCGSRSTWPSSSAARKRAGAWSRSTRARWARRSRCCGSRPGRSSRPTTPCSPTLEPDVEALLVNRARGARRHWLVPIDDLLRARRADPHAAGAG